MPKIAAPTVAEHRGQRRAALLTAAADLMRRGSTFTVAEVASEVGLSRSAVYEYYASAPDLVADVVVDELADWADVLKERTDTSSVDRAIDTWVRATLEYVADGRHKLIKSAASVDLPPTRQAQVQAMHRELVAPLYSALDASGLDDTRRTTRFVWGVVEGAVARIESGAVDTDAEIDAAVAFIRGGIASLS